MINLNYPHFPFTREVLIEKVQEKISDKRFQHVLRVEKKALELAEKYQLDFEKVSIAALVHDYAKEVSDEEFQQIIKEKHLDQDLLKWSNAIWHGVVGQYVIEKELGISDKEILQAVNHHTTGSKNMSDLDKVIYVADFIEDGRDFPGVNEARESANRSLDEGVLFETKHTLLYLINKQSPIHPKTLETYNYYVANKRDI